jgi:hypothetical protein
VRGWPSYKMSKLSSRPYPAQVGRVGAEGKTGPMGAMGAQWAFAPSESGQDVEPDPGSNPDPAKMPAEIVVLLDSEDNPSLPKRSRPRGLRPLELLGQSTEFVMMSVGLGRAGVLRSLGLQG